MAVYSSNGCPVEVASKIELDDGVVALIRAKIVGAYPDGSGADKIGKLLHETDRVAKGWFPPWELRADGGGVEIIEAIAKVPHVEMDDKQFRKIARYYGLTVPA